MENPTRIKPTFDRVLVERYEKDLSVKTTTGTVRLIIPNEAKASLKASQGVIIAIGPAITEFNVGDKVYWSKHSPLDIKVKDKVYAMLMETDILGVIDGDYLDQ